MADEETKTKKVKRTANMYGGGPGGGVYGVGIIGAAVYYIQQAPDFWGGVLGLLKALVWPGFMVYELLKFIGA